MNTEKPPSREKKKRKNRFSLIVSLGGFCALVFFLVAFFSWLTIKHFEPINSSKMIYSSGRNKLIGKSVIVPPLVDTKLKGQTESLSVLPVPSSVSKEASTDQNVQPTIILPREKASVDSAVTAAPQRKEAAEGGIKKGTALGGVKVYIHYARDKDKKRVEVLAAFLRGKGYTSVETEKIPHRKRDIRYFHDEDKDSALLLKKHFDDFIASSAKAAKFNIHIENLSTRYPHAQKGALEMWVFF